MSAMKKDRPYRVVVTLMDGQRFEEKIEASEYYSLGHAALIARDRACSILQTGYRHDVSRHTTESHDGLEWRHWTPQFIKSVHVGPAEE